MLQHITIFGKQIGLYDFFNNFALVAQLITAIAVRKTYINASTLPGLAEMHWGKKKKNAAFVRYGVMIVLVLIVAAVTMLVNKLLGDYITLMFLGTKDANFLPNIFLAPFVLLLMALLFRNEPLKTLDAATPVVAVALIFYKLACFCWGCCNGVEWEHGMWNDHTGRVEFPVQLVEIACAVVMFVILMVLFKKGNQKPGLLFPIFILMYCGSRFVSEFWRDDYPDIWGPLKSYHIQCIIGFVEGLILLFIVLKWGERITAWCEAKNKALLDKHAKKIAAERKPIVHSKKHKKK